MFITNFVYRYSWQANGYLYFDIKNISILRLIVYLNKNQLTDIRDITIFKKFMNKEINWEIDRPFDEFPKEVKKVYQDQFIILRKAFHYGLTQ